MDNYEEVILSNCELSLVLRYLHMNTRETDDNSRSSSVENVVSSAECFDTDAIPRHVHFEQNYGGKNEDNGSSKRTSHANSVEKTEEVCLTQALQQSAKPSQEHESTHGRQNMQNSHNEEKKISSVNLLTNLNLQDKLGEQGQHNGFSSGHVALKENRFGNSEQSVKSSFEDQHLNSPG